MRFYAYYEAMTPESTHFEVASYLMELHHTRTGPEVFKFEVPEGWTWEDNINPKELILHGQDGEIVEEVRS